MLPGGAEAREDGRRRSSLGTFGEGNNTQPGFEEPFVEVMTVNIVHVQVDYSNHHTSLEEEKVWGNNSCT